MNEQQRTAMELALEALENAQANFGEWWPEAITALKEALAQPEHDLYTDEDKEKPDAICDRNGQVALAFCKRCGKAEVELDVPCVEAQPEQPKVRTGDCLLVGVCASEGHKIASQRKPMTDEQINQIADEFIVDYRIPAGSQYDFVRAIEAAHGIRPADLKE